MEKVTEIVEKGVMIRKAQAADLLTILSKASQQKKMPLKFCIAQNIKLLQTPVTEYLDAKEKLFKAAVCLDDEGNGVLKEEFRSHAEKLGGRVLYSMFEFESEAIEKEFNEALKSLNEEEFQIEFVKENANRIIKISNTEGGYEDSTVRDVLEDPNNEITPAMITLFMEYFLEI